MNPSVHRTKEVERRSIKTGKKISLATLLDGGAIAEQTGA
jgi:hypothetical protein